MELTENSLLLNPEYQLINQTDVQTRFKILYVLSGFAKVGQIHIGTEGRDDDNAYHMCEELSSLGLAYKPEVSSDHRIFINYSVNEKNLDDYTTQLKSAGDDIDQIHRVNGIFLVFRKRQ